MTTLEGAGLYPGSHRGGTQMGVPHGARFRAQTVAYRSGPVLRTGGSIGIESDIPQPRKMARQKDIQVARKILLADDSMIAQNMGKRILAEAGYNVVTVSNGAAAMKKIPDERPDIVLLDVYMPGYNGLEVCQQVRSAPETAEIPVILTVGKLEPFSPEEGMRVKADGLIVKPFEATDLLAVVGKLAERLPSESAPKPAPATLKSDIIEEPVAPKVEEFPLPPLAHPADEISHAPREEASVAVPFAEPAPPNSAQFSRFSLELGPIVDTAGSLPAVDVFVPPDDPPQTFHLPELAVETEILQPPDVVPLQVEPELEIGVEPVVPVNGHGMAEPDTEREITLSPEIQDEDSPVISGTETDNTLAAADPEVPNAPEPDTATPQTSSDEPFDITLEPLPDADVDFAILPPEVRRLGSISSLPDLAVKPEFPPSNGDAYTATESGESKVALLIEALEAHASDTLHSVLPADPIKVSEFPVEVEEPILSADAMRSVLNRELEKFLNTRTTLEDHAPAAEQSEDMAALAESLVASELQVEPLAAPEVNQSEPQASSPEPANCESISDEAAPTGPLYEEAFQTERELAAENSLLVSDEEERSTPALAIEAEAIEPAISSASSETESTPDDTEQAEPAEENIMEVPPEALDESADQLPTLSAANITPEALESLTEVLAEQLAERVLQQLKTPLVQEIKRILGGK